MGKPGWGVPPMTNLFFGNDEKAYQFRSKICRAGIYANTPVEAVYPLIAALEDGTEFGERLNAAGGASYTVNLTELPPVLTEYNGFWSVTIYNEAQFLVDNGNDEPPPRTYSLGSQTPLVTKPGKEEGKTEVDILIQVANPGAGVNWLPAPDGPFQLILRVYVPAPAVIDETYVMPTVTKN